MELKEIRLGGEVVYNGNILKVRRDVVQIPGGQTAVREVVEHRGSVAILALTDEDHVLLERQFRYVFGDEMLEIPAGKLEEGDLDPLDCAKRELREETGYSAARWDPLGAVRLAPGCLGEVIHLFLAQGLTPGQTSFDEDERIELLTVSISELEAKIRTGEVVDAKTMAALLRWKLQQAK